jgi:cellulose 1,4-beta-cellobiosidase
MFQRLSLLAFALSAARAQKAGTVTAEVHPSLSWKSCTTSGGCTTVSGSITLDSNWRWSHDATANSYVNCYTGNSWNATLCPSNAACKFSGSHILSYRTEI